jgi:hypothetical protein
MSLVISGQRIADSESVDGGQCGARSKPRRLFTIRYPLSASPQLAFFMTASATLFGTSRYFANSIVKVARPWLIERTDVA